MIRSGYLACSLLLVAPMSLQGQKKVAAAPVVTANVTGRVVFADTNGPARFAKVFLKSTAPSGDDNPFSELMKDDDEEEAAKGKKGPAPKSALTPEEKAANRKRMESATKMFSGLAEMLKATTVAADGTYVLTGVTPGSYYLHAQAKGYVDPLSQFSEAQQASTDPAVRAQIAAVVPTVTVTGADGGHADLRLERGAAISGRVLYDDGTPAAGWTVKVVRGEATPAAADDPFAAIGLDASDMDIAHAQEASISDDTGYYRISGLPTGDYVVQARLTTAAVGRADSGGTGDGGNALLNMMGLRLSVYSGDTVRRADAQTVSVRQGENRADTNLVMPMRSMHALGGTVRSRTDGHPVMGGTVQLTGLAADGKPDPSMHLTSVVHHDGTFRFDFVQGPGTYTLSVADAVDTAPATEAPKKLLGQMMETNKPTMKFGPGTTTATLHDGDVTDVKIEVPEQKSAK